jgi:formate dehydrogenase major subunit
MNVLAEVGESPLPRINSRFGHPTPQNGVEVERKWKRPDYIVPGNGINENGNRRNGNSGNGNGLVQLQTGTQK